MESDKEEIIICQSSRKIFYYSLIWPATEEELHPGIFFKLRLFILVLSTLLINIALTVYLYVMTANYSHADISEVVAVAISIYGCFYLICVFARKQHKLAVLMKDLSYFRNSEKPGGFLEKNKKLNKYGNYVFLYVVFGTIIYTLKKFKAKAECERINQEIGYDPHHCGLICPIWIPFDINFFPAFQLFFIFTVLTIHTDIKIRLHISYSAFEIAHHIKMRINHLKFMILECFNHDNYGISQSKLKKCVFYHQEIIDFADRLNDCYSDCMFGHLMLTGAVCACLGKQIITKNNVVATILHIFGWILALFVGCTSGQLLLDVNSIITEAIWESKWYEADVRLQKEVLFMLMRAQKNFYIRSGPFGVVNNALFLSILKMSYSMLCMLSYVY